MQLDPTRSHHWDMEAVRTFLNRLDKGSGGPRGPDFRRWDRFPYRVKSLHVDVLDDDEHVAARYDAAGRNIARGGISFINQRMIYPGSPCRVRLVGPHRHEQLVKARVAHCRYVVGSGTLYEVGAEFERPVDLAAFAPRARRIELLLVDADPRVHKLVGSYLNSMNVGITVGPATPAGVIKQASDTHPELLLIDLENPAVDAFSVALQLRNLGHVSPIVGLAVQVGELMYARCIESGLTGYLRKPIARQSLRRLVASLMDKPLVSSFVNDPTLAPLIDEFVASLPDRTKAMAAALKRADLGQLDQLAHTLRGEGGSYGFDDITEQATELQLVIAERGDLPRVRVALDKLIHLCLSARPATCGEAPARNQ